MTVESCSIGFVGQLQSKMALLKIVRLLISTRNSNI
jgi:hypothetical protein